MMHRHVDRYINLHRALGKGFAKHERSLREFAAFAADRTDPYVTAALILEWAGRAATPNSAQDRYDQARAFAMFAMGDAVTGAQAAQLGIANAALPKEDLIAAAREAAAKLAQRPLGAVMAAKKLMRDGERLLAQSRTEGAIFAERMRSAEAMEAFTAFREKRAPDFSKTK